MTAHVGSFALAVGLFSAVAGVLLWLRVARRGGDAAPARQAAWLMLLGAGGSCAALEWALVSSDFSVRFVAENGSRATPLYYTVTSLWSALDGSLFLWLLILSAYAVLLARRVPPGAERLHPWAMTVVSAVAVFFFALSLVAGHAFDAVDPAPADGPGPNPLLQDHPAMGVHPPLLYAGYVGLTVPFAYAVAALVTGETGRGWLTAIRAWTLAAWTCLTAGIVLGAWWSYAVLGWGGYWAWDPVENASILPWLTSTALLHSVMIQRRRAALPAWNVGLAGAGFLLVCVGTFLTRSGALASVHSFTESPLGPMLLGLVVAVLGLLAGLLVWRADRLGVTAPLGAVVSRETAILGNNLLLVTLAFTILLGTLFPLLAEVALGQEVSVGPPYFDRMAVPVALVLLLLMAVGPLVRWGSDGARAVASRAAVPAGIGCATVAALGLGGVTGAAPVLTVGLAAMVISAAVRDLGHDLRHGRRRRRHQGGQLVHVGVAVAAVAIAVSSSYPAAVERHLAVGESLTVEGTTARLMDVERSATGGRMSTLARVALFRGGERVGTASPALTFYPARNATVSTPAISSRWSGDVYVTVLDVAEHGEAATLRLAVNPLVGWLWVAGGVMVVGGVLAGIPRRRRPLRVPAEAAPAEEAPAEEAVAATSAEPRP